MSSFSPDPAHITQKIFTMGCQDGLESAVSGNVERKLRALLDCAGTGQKDYTLTLHCAGSPLYRLGHSPGWLSACGCFWQLLNKPSVLTGTLT